MDSSSPEDTKPAARNTLECGNKRGLEKTEGAEEARQEKRMKKDQSSDSESDRDDIANELASAAAAIAAERQGQPTLPEKLRSLLDDGPHEAIWWLPGGKAFAIEPKKFSALVLDKYFQGTKFASFVRRLHKWGFRRETRGFRKELGLRMPRDVTAFCCDLFQRDRPELMASIVEMTKTTKKKETGQLLEGTKEAHETETANKAPRVKKDPPARRASRKAKEEHAFLSNLMAHAEKTSRSNSSDSKDSSDFADGRHDRRTARKDPTPSTHFGDGATHRYEPNQEEQPKHPMDAPFRSLDAQFINFQQIQDNPNLLPTNVQARAQLPEGQLDTPFLAALRQHHSQDPAIMYPTLTASPTRTAASATSNQALLDAVLQERLLGSITGSQRLDEISLAATRAHQSVSGAAHGAAVQGSLFTPLSEQQAAQVGYNAGMLQAMLLLEQFQRQHDGMNRR